VGRESSSLHGAEVFLGGDPALPVDRSAGGLAGAGLSARLVVTHGSGGRKKSSIDSRYGRIPAPLWWSTVPTRSLGSLNLLASPSIKQSRRESSRRRRFVLRRVDMRLWVASPTDFDFVAY
jgi:hypothetical protein